MELIKDASPIERMIISRASIQRIPINGSLELLPLCNMNCDMCYVRLSREEMEGQGRLRTAAEWLELGHQMQKKGVLFLLLTGGEPLLYPDFKEVYLGLKKMGMILTINTNGTLINENWAEFFGQYPPRRINITLYGSCEQTYDKLCHYPAGFEKALHGIQLLRKHDVDVKIGLSLTPSNQTDIPGLHEIGEELGIPVRLDSYMMPAERERKKPFKEQNRLDPVAAARIRISSLQREMGKDLFDAYVLETLSMIETESISKPRSESMTCLAGSCSFTVNWQGLIRPCVVMSGPSAPVFELGFEEAWSRICTEVDQIRLSSTCAACQIRPLCRTCAASALLETGDYDGVPAYMCQYAKESLRLLKNYNRVGGSD